MFNEKIEKWVQKAMKNEDVFDYTITISGKSSTDDGYISNIVYVSVKGKNREGKDRTIDLALKVSKESERLREQTPIEKVFEKEIYIYGRVLKLFVELQEEIGIENMIDFLPKCFATEISNGCEVLVFENLKPLGYGPWDRKKPMTHDHIKLILEAFGKWHAFSFALRKKKKSVFEDLVKDNMNLLGYFFERGGVLNIIWEFFEEGIDTVIPNDKVEVLNKLQFSKADVEYTYKGLLLEDPDYSVILHGDCWNNNFLFKDNGDVTKPIGVSLLDWQMSGLSSPVMDLSYFIYTCCDTGKYRNVSELLKIYYSSLSRTLDRLGCNPGELYPYSKLVEHWKRFSQYGILLTTFLLCEEEHAPDFAEGVENGKPFAENMRFEVANKEEFNRRIRDNLIHYAENLKLME